MVKRMEVGTDIAQVAKDSRLTTPSDGKRYDWKKLIAEVKSLGRPLSEEESKNFLIMNK